MDFNTETRRDGGEGLASQAPRQSSSSLNRSMIFKEANTLGSDAMSEEGRREQFHLNFKYIITCN